MVYSSITLEAEFEAVIPSESKISFSCFILIDFFQQLLLHGVCICSYKNDLLHEDRIMTVISS